MQQSADIMLSLLQRLLTDLSRQALTLDPLTAQRLAAMDGQSVEIRCLAPDMTSHLTLCSDRIDLGVGPADSPNVAISGQPLGLLQTLLTGSSSEPVVIEGDATILMQLQTLASSFSPDLAKPLGNLIGKEKAQRSAALFELGVASISELLSTARKSAHQQAKEVFSDRYASQSEAEVFFSGVDQLRLRVDRLQAKLDLHSQTTGES